jgi:hypothetical protein
MPTLSRLGHSHCRCPASPQMWQNCKRTPNGHFSRNAEDCLRPFGGAMGGLALRPHCVQRALQVLPSRHE